PSCKPCAAASRGATFSELPQTSCESGRGHSCSHALAAKRPSHSDGSGASTSVSAGAPFAGGRSGSFGGGGVTDLTVVSDMTPSCSHCRQLVSKSPAACDCHVSRTSPYGSAERVPARRPTR